MSFDAHLLPEHVELLESAGPGLAVLAHLRDQMLAGDMSPEHNRLSADPTPPADGQIHQWPDQSHRAAGLAAIAAGQVASVVLNGGMATRFGGVVKGVVKVDGEHSFLALKLLDALRVAKAAGGEPPPVILMNSKATHAATLAHLEENNWFGYPSDKVWCFEQQWAVRLTPEGEIFKDAEGQPSFYGPGHGDLATCIKRSGLLEKFMAGGGRLLMMSNVDNVVATLDPTLVGWHLAGAQQISVEVVQKFAGDAGGAPATVDGHLQIVEGFRFPEGFDQSSIPVFNTNTLWFDAQSLAESPELTWFMVKKKAGGAPVIQFERLVGQMTAFLPSAFVKVPREGETTRFVPVKSPEDLEQARAGLMSAWHTRG
ncbi:MAG: UTP--glucose-1-phosphate uridylyltransferase [Bradymonadia bacterium]